MVSNAQVVPIIARGGDAQNRTGSFWGIGSRTVTASIGRGYIPPELAAVLDAVARQHDGVEGIIMSYSTPIAVKIAGVWLRPDVVYSTTTSGKHATHLWQLDCRWLPWDATAEDVENVIAGYTVYDRSTKTFRRGPVDR